MPAVADWNVEQVCDLLSKLELHSLVGPFKENAVNGDDLLNLSDEELKESLGLTTLQVRKIRKAVQAADAHDGPASAPSPGVPSHPPATPAAEGAAAAVPSASLPPALALEPAAAPAAIPAPAAAVVAARAATDEVGTKKKQAEELDRAAQELKAKAAEAQGYAATYGQATALLAQAEGKLQGAVKMLSMTQMTNAMGMVGDARRVGFVAMRPGPAPPGAMRAAMRGPPMQNMASNMIEMGAVKKANEAVQGAGRDVEQARQLLPTLPFIPPASVDSAKAGVFMDALMPGPGGHMMQMAAVQRGVESAKQMAVQVGQSLDWSRRNQQAFEAQAAQHNAVADVKQAEADACRRAALELM